MPGEQGAVRSFYIRKTDIDKLCEKCVLSGFLWDSSRILSEFCSVFNLSFEWIYVMIFQGI